MGTVIVQWGDDKPKKHTCELPDEAPTNTIILCEDCGRYWRCYGQRFTGVVSVPCLPGSSATDSEPKWSELGMFGTWYYLKGKK